jgi:enoyl-CoA hydratase/carnithine racemase
VDTAGAERGLDAELGGISVAVARNLELMGQVPAPVITVITGEAGGAGALANALGDRVLVAEHGMFTLPMVEGALASPFFLRQTGTERSSSGDFPFRSLSAREAHGLGVIDRVIPEPEGGAHLDPNGAIELFRVAIAESLGEVLGTGSRRLLETRVERARQLGLADPEGSDIASRELRELTAIQHAISRSIDDFRHDMRERIEQTRHSIPNLPNKMPTRADFNELAGRITQFRENVTNAAQQARHELVDEWRDKTRDGESG